MTAGTGAEEQAQLVGARVEQKRRELERLEQQQRNWAAGAQGERLVASELDQLRAYGWIVLHDVHWPGRPRANLDHIVAGPGGVLVVDAKNWSGAVTVSDGVLRCSGYRKNREMESTLTQAAAVAALLDDPLHRSLVSGVICLVQQELQPQSVQGATLVGRIHLQEFARQLPVVLDPAVVGRDRGVPGAHPEWSGQPPAADGWSQRSRHDCPAGTGHSWWSAWCLPSISQVPETADQGRASSPQSSPGSTVQVAVPGGRVPDGTTVGSALP